MGDIFTRRFQGAIPLGLIPGPHCLVGHLASMQNKSWQVLSSALQTQMCQPNSSYLLSVVKTPSYYLSQGKSLKTTSSIIVNLAKNAHHLLTWTCTLVIIRQQLPMTPSLRYMPYLPIYASWWNTPSTVGNQASKLFWEKSRNIAIDCLRALLIVSEPYFSLELILALAINFLLTSAWHQIHQPTRQSWRNLMLALKATMLSKSH